MTPNSNTVRLDLARWVDTPSDAIGEIVACPGPDLEIDAAGVEAVPALVAQILLAAQRRVEAAGGRFELVAASDQFKSSLHILGMDHLIEGPKE